MRLRAQLLAALGTAALVTVLVFAGLMHVTRQGERALAEDADAQDVARHVSNLLTLINEFAVHGGERAAAQWSLRHRQLAATIDRALQRASSPPAELFELQRHVDNLAPLFAKLVEQSERADSPLSAQRRELLIEQLLAETQELVERRHRWAESIGAAQAIEQRWYSAMVLAAPVALLFAFLVLSALVVNRVLRPLERLQAAADAVRDGALGARIGSAAPDELGDMARAFDGMTESLQQQSAAMLASNQRLEQEIARRRESERRLRAVADNLPAFMSHVDVDQRYRFVNATLAKAFGSEQAMLGRTMREVRGEAAYQRLQPHAERALAGEVSNFEFHDDAPSRRGYYQASFIPDVDEGGVVRGFYAIMVDVTERKQAGMRLAENEERIRRILAQAPDAFIGIDPGSRIVEWNRQAEQTFGWNRDEAIGRSLTDLLIPPADRARHLDGMQRFAASGEGPLLNTRVELSALHRDGHQIPVEISVAALHTANGWIANAFLRDIRERKDAEARLRASEARLRALMESSLLGVFVADEEGLCQYTNAAWQRIAGLSAEHSLGAGWRRALHPDDRQRVYAEWTQWRPGTPQISEHRYRRGDGSVVWVRCHVSRAQGPDGELRRVGMVEDITERRRLDAALAATSEELRRSNHELEQFAYVASHDLREPLRMVASYSQLLQRRHREQLPQEAREFLDFATDGAQRAQALIADLLGLARVNSQARPMEPVPLDAVLGDTLRALGVAIQESGAVVTHDPLPVVQADRRQIGQLLQNLIGNALKFRSAAPPAVHVGASREAGCWRISVRDNGIGIDPQSHDRIFVLFQRLHLRSEYAGTGIGLAICKKVVERHGGRIGVESTPGRGSTFFFTIADPDAPLVRGEQAGEGS